MSQLSPYMTAETKCLNSLPTWLLKLNVSTLSLYDCWTPNTHKILFLLRRWRKLFKYRYLLELLFKRVFPLQHGRQFIHKHNTAMEITNSLFVSIKHFIWIEVRHLQNFSLKLVPYFLAIFTRLAFSCKWNTRVTVFSDGRCLFLSQNEYFKKIQDLLPYCNVKHTHSKAFESITFGHGAEFT